MKAFITGHNGFIGKNLPTSLEKQGIQAVYSDGRHVNLKFTKKYIKFKGILL